MIHAAFSYSTVFTGFVFYGFDINKLIPAVKALFPLISH